MEIAAHSSGAPLSTCESMEPSHSGAGPSLGACPFETQPEQVRNIHQLEAARIDAVLFF